MAKVKFSGIGITDMRGKIGNDVFFRNRGGNVSRSFTIPANTPSTYKDNIKANWSTIATSWRTLTEEQRKSWFTLLPRWQKAKYFKEGVNISAFDLYMSLNQNLFAVGGSFLTVCPTPIRILRHDYDVIIDSTAGTMIMTFNNFPNALRYVVEATPPLSPGIYNFKKHTRIFTTFTGGTSSPIDLWSDYVTRFSTSPGAGEMVGFRVWIVLFTTGQKYLPILKRVITV